MANTIWNVADKTAGVTISGSSLTAAAPINNGVRAVDGQTAGKFYWEIRFTTADSGYGTGFANTTATLSSLYNVPTNAVIVYASGSFYVNGSNTGPFLNSMASGTNFVCFALDVTGRLVWARNGAAGQWNASGTANPTTGVGGVSVSALGGAAALYPAAAFGFTTSVTANFGDSAFTGVVPSGFTSGFPAAGGGGATVQARAVVMA